MTGQWYSLVGADPAQYTATGQVPDVGRVIGWRSTRTAWRVFRVDDVHPSNWDQQTVAVWQAAGEPPWETWSGRERRVGVEPARHPQPDGKDRRGLRLCSWASTEQWRYLEEPWPECVQCGLLWPCPCHDANVEAVKAVAEFDRYADVMPGCCWACNEPVTGRQSSITFDGENLLMPGAGPAAFHTSHSRKATRDGSRYRTCRGEAEEYEQRWVAAGEGRTVRLRCPGDMWRHFGYSECTNPACPGEGAKHRDWHHCDMAVYTSLVDASTVHTTQLLPPTSCGHLGCKGSKAATIPTETTAGESRA